MVVSVDITGVLEERLRRLVELGLFASVSEAVREGIRLLMKELNLKKIALDIYLTRKASLHYICYFAGEPCPAMIDYMLSRGVQPLLGSREPAAPLGSGRLLLDPSSLLVLYNSMLGEILARRQQELGLELYIGRRSLQYFELLEARALYKGLASRMLRVEVVGPCGNARSLGKLKEYILHDMEREAIEASVSCGIPLVTADLRVQELLARMGASFYNVLSLVEAFRESLGPGEFGELIISLRSVPLILPRVYR